MYTLKFDVLIEGVDPEGVTVTVLDAERVQPDVLVRVTVYVVVVVGVATTEAVVVEFNPTAGAHE